MTDYRIYRLTKQEFFLCLLWAALLALLVSWLFYRSLWGMSSLVVFTLFLIKKKKEDRIKERKRELSFQFKECIRVAAAAMRAGYSPENAFVEAEMEMLGLLGENAPIYTELGELNRQVRLNMVLERLLSDLAFRSGVEEILSFAQVFAHAKRSGGNFIKILNETAERISEKVELSREIQTMIAAKQMEQKIMNVIPMGILLMISIGSPGFLETMYVGLFGRSVMTICLLIYGAAWLLSRKIVDIEI